MEEPGGYSIYTFTLPPPYFNKYGEDIEGESIMVVEPREELRARDLLTSKRKNTTRLSVFCITDVYFQRPKTQHDSHLILLTLLVSPISSYLFDSSYFPTIIMQAIGGGYAWSVRYRYSM